jgi:hypothetical protein
MTIYTPIESPYRVFSKNADFRNVWFDIWLKTPKNYVKIRIFKGSFEKTKKSIFSIEKAYISQFFVLNKLVNGQHLKCRF